MDDCKALRWALSRSVPNPAARSILMTLAEMSVDGVCSASQKEIAAKSFVSERQARTLLALMESSEWGLISREKQGGAGKGRHFDVYRLAMPEQPETTLTAIFAVSDSQGEKASANGNLCACGPELTAILAEPENAIGNFSELEAEFADASEANGNPPHTPHVYSPTVNREAVVADAGADAPPAADATIVAVDWMARLKEAQARAGNAINLTTSATHHVRDLKRLCEPVSGIPCDWDEDVLPAIDTLAASFRKRGEQFYSWGLIATHALKNRDVRLTPLPEPQSELFSDAAGADNVEHFDVERTRQDHRKPQGGKRGSGGRNPVSPFDGVRELINRAREDERRQRNDGMDQPHMRYIGGA